jgi:5-methylcytosine-specific restriction enzyme A
MREEAHHPCCLCGRAFARGQLTKHHCLPKEKGGTQEDVEMLCPQCHGMVHATYTNATLAALYPTIEQLRKAPELEKFLRWVRKQPPTRRKRNAPRRRKI